MTDLDDELLELIEADPDSKKKRKKSKGRTSGPNKKRKTETSESDEDSEDGVLYPLEGKYVDAEDKARLMAMSEIDREEILAERAEELSKKQLRKELSALVQKQDDHASTSKRQHHAPGATKEKHRKLDELKARRKAREEKSRDKGDSANAKERSSSPMDMETSDEEEEDGQISKADQDVEKLYGREGEPITLDDLSTCWLSRDMILKTLMTPWFAEFVKGGWVRYLIGSEDGKPVYRICEVIGVIDEGVKPYRINERTVNQSLELRHGKSSKAWPMDKISNSQFNAKEFDRLRVVCMGDAVNLPTKQGLAKKHENIEKLKAQRMTESDVSAMIARKQQAKNYKPPGWETLERSRLQQAKVLAERRHDFEEVKVVEEQLKALLASEGGDRSARNTRVDDGVLAKLSEKNRKANMEAVRKAEILEAERKRRERQLALSGHSGSSTPDPSARLKTIPRTRMPTSSGAGTPAIGTPLLKPIPDGSNRSVSPQPLGGKPNGLSVIESIEIDLGDF